MTARGLAKRIKRESGRVYPQSRIEAALVEHCRSPERTLRYSHYPSKRTLDILWGHVDVVGEKRNLAELERVDDPDPEHASGFAEDASWVFVSHNHRDFPAALKLRELLARHGFGAWLFENDIEQGEQIAPRVQQAIGECSLFLCYVTRRSIGSLWVRKEIEVALRAERCAAHVVIDGRDDKLRALFEAWTGEWPPERERTGAFCRQAAEKIGQPLGSRWTERCLTFMDLLHEYVGGTNRVLTFPAPPQDKPWQAKKLEMQPFEAFVGDLSRGVSTGSGAA